jgi:hypothetical protein
MILSRMPLAEMILFPRRPHFAGAVALVVLVALFAVLVLVVVSRKD